MKQRGIEKKILGEWDKILKVLDIKKLRLRWDRM